MSRRLLKRSQAKPRNANVGDLFGKAVQLAARLCAYAEPARILIDQVVLDQCSGKQLPLSDLGEVTPKGFDHAVRVYEVQWTQA